MKGNAYRFPRPAFFVEPVYINLYRPGRSPREDLGWFPWKEILPLLLSFLLISPVLIVQGMLVGCPLSPELIIDSLPPLSGDEFNTPFLVGLGSVFSNHV